MQSADAVTPPRGPNIVVTPSLAIDLTWALHASWHLSLRELHPALDELYGENPNLVQRVNSFWDDDSCFEEFQVLAFHSGALGVTDFDELMTLTKAGCRDVPSDFPLRTETDVDRVNINKRLKILSTSPARRREYFDMLTAVWSGLDAAWQAEGLIKAQAACENYRERLARGTAWYEVAVPQCVQVKKIWPDILAENEVSGVVLLVVAFFFGNALALDFPGAFLMGLGTNREDEASRARTEALARRLKVLADPTRLAILDYLGEAPRAVGEIASAFQLAQPTVSTHIKQLREAGVLTSSRQGTRIELTVDNAALVGLLDAVKTLVQ